MANLNKVMLIGRLTRDPRRPDVPTAAARWSKFGFAVSQPARRTADRAVGRRADVHRLRGVQPRRVRQAGRPRSRDRCQKGGQSASRAGCTSTSGTTRTAAASGRSTSSSSITSSSSTRVRAAAAAAAGTAAARRRRDRTAPRAPARGGDDDYGGGGGGAGSGGGRRHPVLTAAGRRRHPVLTRNVTRAGRPGPPLTPDRAPIRWPRPRKKADKAQAAPRRSCPPRRSGSGSRSRRARTAARWSCSSRTWRTSASRATSSR